MSATCDTPFRLSRSCSKARGPSKRISIDGLELQLAGSGDGSVLLIMPRDAHILAVQGAATPAANERFYAVRDAAAAHGVNPLRATPLVMRNSIVGYYIEFDGDAWSALRP